MILRLRPDVDQETIDKLRQLIEETAHLPVEIIPLNEAPEPVWDDALEQCPRCGETYVDMTAPTAEVGSQAIRCGECGFRFTITLDITVTSYEPDEHQEDGPSNMEIATFMWISLKHAGEEPGDGWLDCGEPSPTNMAELTADHFNRHYWLDDSGHRVWEIAEVIADVWAERAEAAALDRPIWQYVDHIDDPTRRPRT